jgi:hypothetical protein
MRRPRLSSKEYAAGLRAACPELAAQMETALRRCGLTTPAEIDLGHYLADTHRGATPTVEQIADLVRMTLKAVPA